MAYRTKLETSGALQIAVGAVLILLGVLAASNGAAPVFAALLILGGALMVTFGIIRNVRQSPAERSHEPPTA